jgi:hypothetical protein
LLEIARRHGLVQEPAAVALRQRLEVIAKMISGLINGLDRREACFGPQGTEASEAEHDPGSVGVNRNRPGIQGEM